MSEEKQEVIEETVDSEVEAEQEVEAKEEIQNENARWYILQCFSNHEYKVQRRILQIIEEKGWESKIVRVLVPEEEAIEIKNNKRVEKVVKIYPGYVFINAEMDDEVWVALRQIQGVSKFVGTNNIAMPVTEDDILKVLRKVGDKTKKIEVDFEMGEDIKVISGPFRGYMGPISEINAEKGKLKALISIFGRETPVELDFDQVEQTIKNR